MPTINFFVTVPDNTPEDETIYITGNHDVLNNWDFEGIPLTLVEENEYHVELEFPEETSIEFKFTRGTWASIEADNDFEPVDNRILEIDEDEEVHIEIENWGDLCDEEQERSLTGNFRIHRNFYSDAVGEDRTIMVYLPPDYSKEEDHYPVLYLHDGQNVFDSATSYGGVEWEIDETAEKLILEGSIRKIIMVGIYNDKHRDAELTHSIDPNEEEGGEVEQYADFVINELKPFIDSNYRTLPESENTALMGSSLGGLCTLYMGWKYPHIFSAIGVVSPSLWWNDRDIIKGIEEDEDFEGPDKIWLDMGTEEGDDEDEDEQPDPIEDTRWLADVLLDKGYVLNESLFYFEAEGADHSEAAWKDRVEDILIALFGI